MNTDLWWGGPVPTYPLPVRAVRESPDEPAQRGDWFAGIPAVAQVLDEGWPLDQVTVVVGENGAGKSTLVEAIAMAFGMGAEGGSTGSRHATRETESPLWRHLRLEREIGASRRGFFLRAETMHSFYSYLEDNPGRVPEPAVPPDVARRVVHRPGDRPHEAEATRALPARRARVGPVVHAAAWPS